MPENVFALGDFVFVTVTTFQGKVVIQVRRYAKYGKTYYPTREGVTLQPWWIEHIVGRKELPQSAEDLRGGLYLPEDQITIQSSDLKTFTFSRIKQLFSGEKIVKSITITAAQWRQMMNQYKAISSVVLDHMYRCMDLMAAYQEMYDLPSDNDMPASLELSLATSYLEEALHTALCDYIKSIGGLKDPETKAEEVWGNRVETFNAAALVIDAKELAHYFYDSLWQEQNFLTLKPAMYLTCNFFKNVQLSNVLNKVRNILCPDNTFEYFEDMEDFL